MPWRSSWPNLSAVPHARLGQKAPLNLTLQAGNGRMRKAWKLFLLVCCCFRVEMGDESRIRCGDYCNHFGAWNFQVYLKVDRLGHFHMCIAQNVEAPPHLRKNGSTLNKVLDFFLVKAVWVRHGQAVEWTSYKYIILANKVLFFRWVELQL